jgi:hypothetical protein
LARGLVGRSNRIADSCNTVVRRRPCVRSIGMSPRSDRIRRDTRHRLGSCGCIAAQPRRAGPLFPPPMQTDSTYT